MVESKIIVFPGAEKEQSADISYLSNLIGEVDERISIGQKLEELINGMSVELASNQFVMESDSGEKISVTIGSVLRTISEQMDRDASLRLRVAENRVDQPILDI